MPLSIKERLRRQARKSFVGRDVEMDTLLEALAEEGALVTFVYGLGGIGKSSLLNAFVTESQAVSRVDLLEEVWGYKYDGGGSNVVDAVIRSLRKKLGPRAAAIETVTGVGYRFQGFAEA